MLKTKYLVLGSGAAGLSFANRLRQMGEESFLVLEKEAAAGGLCRSEMVDGAPLDIGGGHFLDVKRPEVNRFLFAFMPEEEWNHFNRDSQIMLENDIVHHPLEANIWEMSIESQVEYLKSISRAGCNLGEPEPERFVDWIYWKLGNKIADDYMIPYNRKMFADDLDDLGTYWLEKLPNVSFEDTLLSCLSHKAYGTQPGHAEFFYPKKYGYGELWLRMADVIREHIEYKAKVTFIDFDNKIVKTTDGGCYQAEYIISSIPWKEFHTLDGMSEEIQSCISYLRHSGIEVRYYPGQLDTTAQWIYYPDESLPYHRILVRHNFCAGHRGYWTETRKERIPMFPQEDNYRYLNPYAYPLNTLGKPEAMQKLLSWAKEKQVYGLGRWGEHQHFNSDVTVERAIALAEKLV